MKIQFLFLLLFSSSLVCGNTQETTSTQPVCIVKTPIQNTQLLAVSPQRPFDSETLILQGYSRECVHTALGLLKLSPEEIIEKNETVLKGICTTTETTIAQLNIAVAQIVI